MKRSRLFQLFALGALALSSGCDTRNPAIPSFQPQVINQPNDFGLQVTALDAVTQDVQYTWQNDGSATSVIQSPTNLTGTAMLFITDGAGVQVYQRSLAENGTFMTTAGAPGNWTVRIHLAEASGALTLRLKHP